MLSANQCLKESKLSGNENFGDDGIKHLAQTLRDNQSLKILHVSDCGMTDDGLKQLAMTLTHNNSLAELTIARFAQNQQNKFTNALWSRSISISVPETKYYTLTKFLIPPMLSTMGMAEFRSVNAVRKTKGLPLISIIAPVDSHARTFKTDFVA